MTLVCCCCRRCCWGWVVLLYSATWAAGLPEELLPPVAPSLAKEECACGQGCLVVALPARPGQAYFAQRVAACASEGRGGRLLWM